MLTSGPGCPSLSFGAGCGTVFKLTPPTNSGGAWTESVIYGFCRLSNCSDGASPTWAGVIMDGSGALYGTTQFGGNGRCTWVFPGCGTVFKLTPPCRGWRVMG
jgi:hypothetical protein